MRRLAGGLLVVVLIMGAPLIGYADDVRDGKVCNESDESFVDTPWLMDPDPGKTDDVDRGGVCIRAEGTTVFYLGGELQAEDPDNRGRAGGGSSQNTHGACGAFIFMDGTFGSGHANRNSNNPGSQDPGPYPGGTQSSAERDANWDFMHSHDPGLDAIWRTDDDNWHHHHCD